MGSTILCERAVAVKAITGSPCHLGLERFVFRICAYITRPTAHYDSDDDEMSNVTLPDSSSASSSNFPCHSAIKNAIIPSLPWILRRNKSVCEQVDR